MFLQENELQLVAETAVHSDFDTNLDLQELSEAMLEAQTAFHALERQAMLEQYSAEKECGFLTEGAVAKIEDGEEKEGMKSKLKGKADAIGSAAKKFGKGAAEAAAKLWDKIVEIFERVFNKLATVFKSDEKFLAANKAKIQAFDGKFTANVHANTLNPQKVVDYGNKHIIIGNKAAGKILTGGAANSKFVSGEGSKLTVDTKGLRAELRDGMLGAVGKHNFGKGEVAKVLSGFEALVSRAPKLATLAKNAQATAKAAKASFAKSGDGEDKAKVAKNNAAAEVVRNTLAEAAACINKTRAECRGVLSKASRGKAPEGKKEEKASDSKELAVKQESAELEVNAETDFLL